MPADIATPIFIAEFIDPMDESTNYAQVRLCTKRHRGEWFDHFNSSYTYISNGAHIDMTWDCIVKVHYVETYDRLRSMLPDHHLLPENR